jgi:hypothetical protein
MEQLLKPFEESIYLDGEKYRKGWYLLDSVKVHSYHINEKESKEIDGRTASGKLRLSIKEVGTGKEAIVDVREISIEREVVSHVTNNGQSQVKTSKENDIYKKLWFNEGKFDLIDNKVAKLSVYTYFHNLCDTNMKGKISGIFYNDKVLTVPFSNYFGITGWKFVRPVPLMQSYKTHIEFCEALLEYCNEYDLHIANYIQCYLHYYQEMGEEKAARKTYIIYRTDKFGKRSGDYDSFDVLFLYMTEFKELPDKFTFEDLYRKCIKPNVIEKSVY